MTRTASQILPVAVLLAVTGMLLAPGTAQAAPCRDGAPAGGPVVLQSIPAIPGLQVELEGRVLAAGANGRIALGGGHCSDAPLRIMPLRTPLAKDSYAQFRRFYGQASLGRGGTVRAVFDVHRTIGLDFVDLQGRVIPRTAVGRVLLKSSLGVEHELPADEATTTLQASRVVPLNNGLENKEIYYSVQSVDVGGNNLVNRSQTKFFPTREGRVRVPLQYYRAEVRARDAFFGFPVGSRLVVKYPDGAVEGHPLDEAGRVVIPRLPRGDYHVGVVAPALRIDRPIAMSRDQDVELKVFTYLDVATCVVVGLALSVGLVVLGGRRHRRTHRAAEPPPAPPRPEPYGEAPAPARVTGRSPWAAVVTGGSGSWEMRSQHRAAGCRPELVGVGCGPELQAVLVRAGPGIDAPAVEAP